MNHRWQETFRDHCRTVRACTREGCNIIKVSRHEWEGPREVHWTEFYCGSERLQGDRTPVCEAVEVAA